VVLTYLLLARKAERAQTPAATVKAGYGGVLLV
jgi:hypothetical protein